MKGPNKDSCGNSRGEEHGHRARFRASALRCCLLSAVLAVAPAQGEVPEVDILDDNQGFNLQGIAAKGLQDLPMKGHTEAVTSVAFSPDGRSALSGSEDSTLRLWDLDSGRILRVFKGHKGSVRSVAFSPDGRSALSASADKTLRLWDLDSGRALRVFKGHKGSVRSVAFSPDGRRALSGGYDKTLRLWDLDSGSTLRLFKGHKGSVRSVAFSPDGRRALSASWDNTLRLWDLDSGSTLRLFRGHKNGVLSVTFSPDGRRALSGSNKTLRLWDLDSRRSLRVFKGHRGGVTSVAFSPDGRRALSASTDKTLILWDLDSGRSLRVFKGHTAAVNSVAFSPDGRRALSGSSDKTLRLGKIGSQPSQQPSSQLSPQALRQAVPQEAERQFQKLLTDFVGPSVAEPDLPPVQAIDKDPFETRKMYEERIARTRTERAQQVAGIQRQYRTRVEQRNARVGQFEKNLEQWKLRAYAQAYAQVHQSPLLKALQVDGGPKYDAERGLMYARLRYEGAKEGSEVALKVSPGDPARTLYQALQYGEAAASVEYRYRDGELVLDRVSARHQGRNYQGAIGPGEDFVSPAPLRTVLGSKDAVQALQLQNPNLQDVQFEAYLVRERQAFDDDIPQLLERARKAPVDRRKWLFAIGAEKYQQAPDINYSRRSAQLFADVATKVLGIQAGRRVVLLDEEATGGSIRDRLKLMLRDVQPGDSIYFYYSGHGIPVKKEDNAPYILPTDMIPDFVADDPSLRVENIYKQLQASPAGQVMVFMDSCFTGMADEQSVFSGSKAAVRLAPRRYRIEPRGKLAVLTAGTEDQFSSAYGQKGHRLFSYFLMKGLLKNPGNVGALAERVSADVTSTSLDLGGGLKKQNPVFQGNKALKL